jgi:signal transduction histidine kinase
VRITIEDNGQGVPEDKREIIFAEGVSLSAGGTGLGLALVREVFERELKGVVVCESSPLGGARFVIRVPAAGVSA